MPVGADNVTLGVTVVGDAVGAFVGGSVGFVVVVVVRFDEYISVVSFLVVAIVVVSLVVAIAVVSLVVAIVVVVVAIVIVSFLVVVVVAVFARSTRILSKEVVSARKDGSSIDLLGSDHAEKTTIRTNPTGTNVPFRVVFFFFASTILWRTVRTI